MLYLYVQLVFLATNWIMESKGKGTRRNKSKRTNFKDSQSNKLPPKTGNLKDSIESVESHTTVEKEDIIQVAINQLKQTINNSLAIVKAQPSIKPVMGDVNMDSAKPLPEVPEKSREEVLAERKAKKAEKAARRSDGGKTSKQNDKPLATKDGKSEESGKSKSELRAERRQKQEAQRAAKMATTQGDSKPAVVAKAPQPKRISEQNQNERQSVEKRIIRRLASQVASDPPPAQRKVPLFSHLQEEEKGKNINLLPYHLLVNQDIIHPAIIQLGLRYADGVVRGSNARALALLLALKRVIADYSTPEHKELSRDLEGKLKPCISFLKEQRPISVSMGNAIRYVKRQITSVPPKMSDAEAKEYLFESIDNYIKENIELAGIAISEKAGEKIASGDVVLTYGFSSLLLHILLAAYEKGKKFRVVVLDGRPHYEGLQFLRRLAAKGVPADYMLISAASYIMPEVTKVFLGAHALLANGNVMSRIGSSQVALIAKSYNVPVLVCCETHKFCERVLTDSFVSNELGNPDELMLIRQQPSDSLAKWGEMGKLNLLNLTYDVTPADLVSAVITELAILPCTSVPVVLRVKHAETAM